MSLLSDPNEKDKSFQRRGLVIGDVQSGKTGNYLSLITKAADAGYKFIIVIAGIHNNLRSQTQQRIDEGFIGRVSARDSNKIPIELGLNLMVNSHIQFHLLQLNRTSIKLLQPV